MRRDIFLPLLSLFAFASFLLISIASCEKQIVEEDLNGFDVKQEHLENPVFLNGSPNKRAATSWYCIDFQSTVTVQLYLSGNHQATYTGASFCWFLDNTIDCLRHGEWEFVMSKCENATITYYRNGSVLDTESKKFVKGGGNYYRILGKDKLGSDAIKFGNCANWGKLCI